MILKKCLVVLLVLVLTLSCVPAFAEYSMPYYIEVDLTNQIVTVYNSRDNSIARQMLCSAGTGDRTPTGEWFMPAKERDDERTEWYWMPNAYTWVKYATKFYYAYFFHSIPFNDDSDDSINQEALEKFGNPASHGCIRLRVEDAHFIATECLKGTYVRIFRSGERDENLRALLYEGTYSQDSGISYAEFLGISKDDLGMGSTGSDVEDLQRRLSDLGYYTGSFDGTYGEGTAEAMMHLQKDMGILPTGICTPALLEEIYSPNAPVLTGKTTISEGQSGPVVEKLQLALQELGIYQGPIDTIYDSEVTEAVSSFQRLCGIPEDGIATPEMQHAIYYVLNKVHTEMGGKEFTVEQITEDVVYGTLDASANINVREKMDTESDRLGIVEIGERLLVLKLEGSWAQIVHDGKIGYIYKKYLKNPENEQLYTLKYTSPSGGSFTLGTSVQNLGSDNSDLLKAISSSYSSGATMDYLHDVTIEYATVNTGDDALKLNMRADASADATVLGMAANGTSMRVLRRDGEWTKAVYNGQVVYLMSSYLTFTEGKLDDEADAAASQKTPASSSRAKVRVEGDVIGAKVYVSSSTDASIYMHAINDLEVNVVSYCQDTGWALISYEDNFGFMRIENLELL